MNNERELGGCAEPVGGRKPDVTLGVVWRIVCWIASCVLSVSFTLCGQLRCGYSQEVSSVREVVKNFFVRQDCNSSNCHGAALDIGKIGRRGESEFGSEIWKYSGEIWFERDPHSSAYVGLLSQDPIAHR